MATTLEKPRRLEHGPQSSRDLDDVLAGKAYTGPEPTARSEESAGDVATGPKPWQTEWWRSWQWCPPLIRPTLWRLRKQALPAAVTLGLLAIAAALAGLDWYNHNAIAAAEKAAREATAAKDGAALPIQDPSELSDWTAAIVATAAVACILALLVGRAVVWPRLPRQWRTRCAAGAIFAALWLSTSVLWFGPGAILALLLVWLMLSARWNRRHRIRNTTLEPEPEPEPELDLEPEPELDETLENWYDHVANAKGPLPATVLRDPTPIDRGRQYTIEYVPGSGGIEDVFQAMKRISTALNIPADRLFFDHHPDHPDVPRLGVLRVMERTPKDDNPPYEGPSWNNGTVNIGPYMDWQGEAEWRFWSADDVKGGSAWGGMIVGETGSGKSTVVESLAISAIASGLCVVWFVDPQQGKSSPALKECADWYIDKTGWPRMLRAVERIKDWREREDTHSGRSGFEPTPERPLLVVFMDEAHELLKPGSPLTSKFKDFVRACRKVGIVFVVLTQHTELEAFGGDEVIRSQILAGNGICLRSSSNYTWRLMAGMKLDSSKLPKGGGYGYTMDRPVPFRNRRPADALAWMRQVLPNAAMLEAAAAAAAGPHYASRHEQTMNAVAADTAAVQAVHAGALSVEDVIGPYTDYDDGAERPGTLVPMPRGGHPAVPSRGRIPRYADYAGGSQPTEPTVTAANLTPGHLAVLNAIQAGHTTAADITAATGLSKARVYQVLPQLVTAGYLVKDGSRYTPAEGSVSAADGDDEAASRLLTVLASHDPEVQQIILEHRDGLDPELAKQAVAELVGHVDQPTLEQLAAVDNATASRLLAALERDNWVVRDAGSDGHTRWRLGENAYAVADADSPGDEGQEDGDPS